MMTMVIFRSAGAAYAIPVQVTRAVRPADGMVALPAPASDVAGIIPGDPPLTVISPLGSGGTHVLVLEADSKTFGLLVDEVTGLIRLADVGVCQAPRGQARPFISGTIDDDGQLVLIADARALAGRL
jgi:chemotaxis signal transduction protein